MFEQNDNRKIAELNMVNTFVLTSEQKSKPDPVILNPDRQRVSTIRTEVFGMEPGDSVEIVEISPLGNVTSLVTILADGIYSNNVLTLVSAYTIIGVQVSLSNPEGTAVGFFVG